MREYTLEELTEILRGLSAGDRVEYYHPSYPKVNGKFFGVIKEKLGPFTARVKWDDPELIKDRFQEEYRMGGTVLWADRDDYPIGAVLIPAYQTQDYDPNQNGDEEDDI